MYIQMVRNSIPDRVKYKESGSGSEMEWNRMSRRLESTGLQRLGRFSKKIWRGHECVEGKRNANGGNGRSVGR